MRKGETVTVSTRNVDDLCDAQFLYQSRSEWSAFRWAATETRAAAPRKHLQHRVTGIFIFTASVNVCRISASVYILCEVCVYTWPADVKASDDWLPAHTFLIMKPCRASTTLGLYTRFVSPCPSLPAIHKHTFVITDWSVKSVPVEMLMFGDLQKHTIITSSERPDDTAVLCHSDGVRAPTGHLTHPADVLHKSGHVTTVTVAVSYITDRWRISPRLGILAPSWEII